MLMYELVQVPCSRYLKRSAFNSCYVIERWFVSLWGRNFWLVYGIVANPALQGIWVAMFCIDNSGIRSQQRPHVTPKQVGWSFNSICGNWTRNQQLVGRLWPSMGYCARNNSNNNIINITAFIILKTVATEFIHLGKNPVWYDTNWFSWPLA